RESQQQRGETDGKRHTAPHIKTLPAGQLDRLAQCADAPKRTDDAERNIDPKNPAPRNRGEDSAEHRTQHKARRDGNLIDAERQTESLAAKRVGHNRRTVSKQQRAADTLNHAIQNQIPTVKWL